MNREHGFSKAPKNRTSDHPRDFCDSNPLKIRGYVVDSVALEDPRFFDFEINPPGVWEFGRSGFAEDVMNSIEELGRGIRVFCSGWLRGMPRVLVFVVGRGALGRRSARSVQLCGTFRTMFVKIGGLIRAFGEPYHVGGCLLAMGIQTRSRWARDMGSSHARVFLCALESGAGFGGNVRYCL